MKRILAAVLMVGLAATASAKTFKIDPAHSTVGVKVSHMVINRTSGKFTEFLILPLSRKSIS